MFPEVFEEKGRATPAANSSSPHSSASCFSSSPTLSSFFASTCSTFSVSDHRLFEFQLGYENSAKGKEVKEQYSLRYKRYKSLLNWTKMSKQHI